MKAFSNRFLAKYNNTESRPEWATIAINVVFYKSVVGCTHKGRE